MKYYLETNAIYELRNIPKKIIDKSFTSAFVLVFLHVKSEESI
ncbi:hypothetical protein [Pedobacter gandavensis]|nr:hypothetical protein [Pedobacter gandavensis]